MTWASKTYGVAYTPKDPVAFENLFKRLIELKTVEEREAVLRDAYDTHMTPSDVFNAGRNAQISKPVRRAT
jgi:hypothetical protein